MDFHIHLILVNISLFSTALFLEQPARADERATLTDGRTIVGHFAMDASDLVFRTPKNGLALPADRIRRIVRTRPGSLAPGPSPGHRLRFWGDESLSGTIRSLDATAVSVRVADGSDLHVPLYLISSIEHFQGDALLLGDDMEGDQPARRISAAAKPSVAKAASGEASLRLAASGGSVEYELAEPVGRGWLELKFFDSGVVQPGREWTCELEFTSPAGPRTLEVLLGWEGETYGLATPQGPSLAVQRLARRTGWNRLGVRFAPDRTIVLVGDAVLTHAAVGMGRLQAIRIRTRSEEAVDDADEHSSGYIDDLQVAETVGTAAERQPSPDQDDVLLTSGDQVFGTLESATDREVTIRSDFGPYSVPWRRVQSIHFSARPCPVQSLEGRRVRVGFDVAESWESSASGGDQLEGIIREVDEASVRLDHPHVGSVRLLRRQVREIEILPAGHWLSVDAGFHHFGNRLKVRFPLPHPEGSERTWSFSLAEPPEQAALELNVLDMEAMVPGARYYDELKSGELRTYVSLNGQALDEQGLNHLLPHNATSPVRLVLPIAPGTLRAGENVLRLYQVPQRVDPNSFDDCGVFGIGLVLDGK